jgi:hypothetical protein
MDGVNLGIRQWMRAEKRENCSLMSTSTSTGPCRTLAFELPNNGMRPHTARTARARLQRLSESATIRKCRPTARRGKSIGGAVVVTTAHQSPRVLSRPRNGERVGVLPRDRPSIPAGAASGARPALPSGPAARI